MVEEQPDEQFRFMLGRLRNRLWVDWRPVDRELPDTLYHYTNTEGLLGILDKSRLWATDIHYLNDPSELQYACDLVREVLDEKPPDHFGPLARGFLAQARHLFNPYDQCNRAFICSFSIDGNDLSQWRAYSDGGRGFNIGIPARSLAIHDRAELDQKLLAVVYDEDEQLSRVRKVLDLIGTELQNNAALIPAGMDQDTAAFHACQLLRELMAEFLVSYKHPDYRVEKEWRVVRQSVTGDYTKHLKFRSAAAGLTPYVELDCSLLVPWLPQRHPDFPAPVSDKLPISCITVGPKSDHDLSEQALRLLLLQKGFDWVEINHSAAPIRS